MSQHLWHPYTSTTEYAQTLIAPRSVKYFPQEEELLGDKKMLEQQIQETTGIPITALSGSPLTKFSIEERLR